jgi:uncharacterized UBP type Zn finger protein
MGFNDREKKREAGRGVVSAIAGRNEAEEKTAATMGRPKAEKETKKRVSLAILPSLYEDIQKIAYVERKSVSEIVAQCLEQYASENIDKLKEHDKIKENG